MASRAPLRLVRNASAGADERHPSRLRGIIDLDDAKLVALARERDTLAFEALYRRHAAFAMNLAVRIQGSASDVEDVVHDAFVRASVRLGELREPSLFKSWLGAIVVRLVRTRLRRQRLMGAIGLGGGTEPVDLDALASTDASPEARAQIAQIYALLQTMPASDRIAWTLRYVEHHRLEGVADLSECSLATAKRRISRAQKFLNAYFVAPFANSEGEQ